MTTLNDPRPYRLAAILLGIGLGGFFDGIVLHQVLQWHHYISGVNPPVDQAALELNVFVDGLFHSATWIVTVVAIVLFWRAVQLSRLPDARYLVGGALVGWGIFNVADSVLNHYLLGLHHIRPGPDEALWDLAFLAWGAAMVAGGWWLMRRAPARTASGGELGRV